MTPAMTRALVGLAAALLFACAAPAPATAPALEIVPLQNSGFEAPYPEGSRCPAKWGCPMHADPSSYRFFIDTSAPAEGRQSLCIERVTNEPWALATQGLFDPALRGKRLRLSIAVSTEGVAGGAGAFVAVHGDSGALFHEERLIKGDHGWQRLQVEFSVDPRAAYVEVGATLQGPGRVCIDDARVEILPAAKSPV